MLSPLPVSPHLQLPLCFPLGPTSVSTIFSGTTGLRGILNYSIEVRFILHLRLPLLPSISDSFVMILLLLYTLSSFEKILYLFEQVQTFWCMVSLFQQDLSALLSIVYLSMCSFGEESRVNFRAQSLVSYRLLIYLLKGEKFIRCIILLLKAENININSSNFGNRKECLRIRLATCRFGRQSTLVLKTGTNDKM